MGVLPSAALREIPGLTGFRLALGYGAGNRVGAWGGLVRTAGADRTRMATPEAGWEGSGCQRQLEMNPLGAQLADHGGYRHLRLRPGRGGDTQVMPGRTLTWDARGHLAAVKTTATGQVQSRIYDADGQLLVQSDPVNGSIAYLGDTRAPSGYECDVDRATDVHPFRVVRRSAAGPRRVGCPVGG